MLWDSALKKKLFFTIWPAPSIIGSTPYVLTNLYLVVQIFFKKLITCSMRSIWVIENAYSDVLKKCYILCTTFIHFQIKHSNAGVVPFFLFICSTLHIIVLLELWVSSMANVFLTQIKLPTKKAKSSLRTSAQMTLRTPPEIPFPPRSLFASLLNFYFSYCVIKFLTFFIYILKYLSRLNLILQIKNTPGTIVPV